VIVQPHTTTVVNIYIGRLIVCAQCEPQQQGIALARVSVGGRDKEWRAQRRGHHREAGGSRGEEGEVGGVHGRDQAAGNQLQNQGSVGRH
jgi:hypothetical protein